MEVPHDTTEDEGKKLRIFPIFGGRRDVRIIGEIDSWLQHIWLKVVKKEYQRGRILEECNLS